MTVKFEPWPKIARLNREIVVTEKIDGTNAAVVIVRADQVDRIESNSFADEGVRVDILEPDMVALAHGYVVFAQSRTRFITPQQDNYGFAQWVRQNAVALVEQLGEGRHYGEWWGKKIQRGYGMDHKAFSLFNTSRWDADEIAESDIPGLDVVPILYAGPFSQNAITRALSDLEIDGSLAAYERGAGQGHEAEGVVVFHTAANTAFKVTLKGDEAPKGAAGHALDESP